MQLHAADLEEPQRPGDVSVPAPYLSLQFDEDGNPYDPKGNADFTIKGSVGKYEVKYQDQDYTVKSYRATGEGEYIDVFFKNIDSADTWSNFILSGCSFELFGPWIKPWENSRLFHKCEWRRCSSLYKTSDIAAELPGW